MKNQLLTLALCTLGMGAMAQDSPLAGWTEVTTLADLNAKVNSDNYYFVITHTDNSLMLGLAQGVKQGSDFRAPFYQTACNPATDQTKVWIIEPNTAVSTFSGGQTTSDNNKFAIRNASNPGLCLQTEYKAPFNIRTHDQYRDIDWSQWMLSEATGGWQIHNTMFGEDQYVGLWTPNNGYNNGEELAANKSAADAATYKLYVKTRTDYWSEYSAEIAPNTDITFLIKNNALEGGVLDWNRYDKGDYWERFINSSSTAKAPGMSSDYALTWAGDDYPHNSDFNQVISLSLPAGLYRATVKSVAYGTTVDFYVKERDAEEYLSSVQLSSSSEGPSEFSLPFNLETATQNLQIGVLVHQSGKGTAPMVAVDDFTLTYVEAAPDYAGLYSAEYSEKATEVGAMKISQAARTTWDAIPSTCTNNFSAYNSAVAAMTEAYNVALLSASKYSAAQNAINAATARNDARHEGYALGMYHFGDKASITSFIKGKQATLESAATDDIIDAINSEIEAEEANWPAHKANANAKYVINHVANSDMYLTNSDGVRLSETPSYFTLSAASNGKYKLVSVVEDTEKYVGYAGKWDTSNTAQSEWAINFIGSGKYTLQGGNGCLGTDATTESSLCYSNKDGKDSKHQWYISMVSLDYTITDAGWGTVIVPFDAAKPEGMNVWSCKSYADGYLKLEAADAIVANTPYLVSGEAGTYTIAGTPAKEKVDNTKPDNTGNLKGAYYKQTVAAGDYLLQKNNDKVGFYRVDSDNTLTIGANRCYLSLPAEAAPIRAWYFNIDGDTTTSIDDVKQSKSSDNIYDMQGRKVKEMRHGGMYIVNGNKTIVR